MSAEYPSTPQPILSVRKLAALMGVSHSTISRAFRPEASIDPTLRKRILAKAKALGYRPDPMVAELMRGFAKRRPVHYRETFGVLWWDERWRGVREEESFAAQLRAGMECAAGHYGCRLDHFVLKNDNDARSLTHVLQTRQIHGLLITPPSVVLKQALRLDWSAFSVVTIGSSFGEPRFHSARHHHFDSMVKVLAKLKERGLMRPLLLLNRSLEERMQQAYAAAFLAQNPNSSRFILYAEDHDPNEIQTRLKRLRPDALIGDSDGWHHTLQMPSRQSPGLPYLSLDVHDPQGIISGIYQRVKSISENAIDLLIQTRMRQETDIPDAPKILMTPGRWIEGKTLWQADQFASKNG